MMNRTQRTIDLMLYLQRLPRPFEAVRARYPRTSERSLWRMLADLRDAANLTIDRRGCYSVPVVYYGNGAERRVR